MITHRFPFSDFLDAFETANDASSAAKVLLQVRLSTAARSPFTRALARSFGRNMTLDEIVNAARKTTGLPDPEQDSWREGLEILLRDHAKADVLTERGRGILKARYTNALATRMRVDDYLRHNPQLTKTPVEAAGVHPRHAAYGHHDGELSDGRRSGQPLAC